MTTSPPIQRIFTAGGNPSFAIADLAKTLDSAS
jgi:hypothetical protein